MRTLLLADDNVTVQRVIALTFAKEPVRVVTASDGHQAMDRVVVERPDIVLAGTTLPEVNGYELARFVKSKAELKNVPVLLLSGAFETVDEAQLKSSGANGVIEKPVEPTAMINRVKELLGIKSDVQPSGSGQPEPPLPTTPRVVTTSRPMPADTRPGKTTASGGPSSSGKQTNDLKSLDSAFDTLDRQLSGKLPTTPSHGAPPPARGSASTVEPAQPPSFDDAAPGNPVYEVDNDWFGDGAGTDAARGGSNQELVDELRHPDFQKAASGSSQPVFEVDDEWFAEGQRAREARETEQRQLAAEMGIHEVDLPDANPIAPAVSDDDFSYDFNDLPPVAQDPAAAAAAAVARDLDAIAAALVGPEHEAPAIEPPAADLPVEKASVAQAIAPTPEPSAEAASVAVSEPPAAPIVQDAAASVSTPVAPSADSMPSAVMPQVIEAAASQATQDRKIDGPPPRVADDFAALLAFEQGEKKAPPVIEPVIRTVAPEITPAMLEQIAGSVADRLKGSVRVEAPAPEINDAVLDQLAQRVTERLQGAVSIEAMRDSLASAVRDTVRDVVLETSERLVREEIERIKSKNQ